MIHMVETWIVFLVLQLIFLQYIYTPVGSVMKKLENNQSCSDQEVMDAAMRNSRLTIQATFFYMVIWITACSINFADYLTHDIGLLSAMSIWGGGIAGAIACPLMVLGSVSLITGTDTEFINDNLRKRNLDVEGTRIRIFTKLIYGRWESQNASCHHKL